MPRLLPAAFLDAKSNNKNIVTHSTLQLTLLGDAVPTKAWFFASAALTIDGVKYSANVQKTTQVKNSLARSVDSGTIKLQNLDNVLGIALIDAKEQLYGAEVKLGRFRMDVEGMTVGHKNILTGVVSSVQVDQQSVTLTIISDAYAATSVGATRVVAPDCQWTFRDPLTCQYAGDQIVCSFLLENLSGCKGRHGNNRNAKFGGMAFVTATATAASNDLLATPAANQLFKTDTASFAQQPFVKISGASIVNNPTTKTTEIAISGPSDWINVRDYGAVGDGVTNDSPAFALAVAAAVAGPRKTVYAPAGIWHIPTTITLPGRVRLLGSGQGATVLYSTSNAPIIVMERDALFRTAYIELLTIRGNSTGSNQHGLVCDTTPFQYGGVVRDVRFENTGGYGLYVGLTFSSVWENLFFDNCQRYSLVYNAPNQPGNVFKSCYVGDLGPGVICGFRIRSGFFIGHDLNGVNNIVANSAWMIVGIKNGIDGDVTDGGASVDLTSSNVESWDSFGIALYSSSTIDLRSTIFASNQNVGHAVDQYPLYFDLAGDGTAFFAPYLRRGRIDDSVNFANGLSVYKFNQAIHANGCPNIEIEGAGPAAGGLTPVATYYNNINGQVEHLIRRDGRVRRRLITAATTIYPLGATYIEVDSTGGAFTLSLYWAGWNQNVQNPLYIKDVGGACSTNPVTVNAAGGATIDGAGSFAMDLNNQAMILIPNGDTVTADWRIISQYPAPVRATPTPATPYDIEDWNGSGNIVPFVLKGSVNNGGMTPNGKLPVLIIYRDGIPFEAFASIAEFLVERYENAGSNARTGLTIALTHGNGDPAGTEVVEFRSDKSAKFFGEAGGPQTVLSGSGAQSLDWSISNQIEFTLSGNTTFTFSNGKAGHRYILRTKNHTTAALVTWPGNVKWPGGTAMPLTTANNAVDVWEFYFDGTNFQNFHQAYDVK